MLYFKCNDWQKKSDYIISYPKPHKFPITQIKIQSLPQLKWYLLSVVTFPLSSFSSLSLVSGSIPRLFLSQGLPPSSHIPQSLATFKALLKCHHLIVAFPAWTSLFSSLYYGLFFIQTFNITDIYVWCLPSQQECTLDQGKDIIWLGVFLDP